MVSSSANGGSWVRNAKSSGRSTCPLTWAVAGRSCAIAVRPGLYPPRAKIDDTYVQTWRPVAEAQLRRGGAQLAALLNGALGD